MGDVGQPHDVEGRQLLHHIHMKAWIVLISYEAIRESENNVHTIARLGLPVVQWLWQLMLSHSIYIFNLKESLMCRVQR